MAELRRLLVVFVLAMAFVPRAASALPGGAGDPSIVIGLLATLTGPGAMAGQDVADGFALALRQLGGRFANQEVRVVTADDKGTPDGAVRQVAHLLESERLDMVVTAVSPSALAAVLPKLHKANMIVISLGEVPPSLAGAACDPDVFVAGTPPDGPPEALGVQLATTEAHRVVVVGPDSDLTGKSVEALRKTFPGEVAAVLVPRHGAAVYGREIEQIRKIRPDAVYSLLTGGMGVEFVLAFDAAGLKGEIPLYSVAEAVERPTLPALGEAGLDILSIGAWSPDLDQPASRRFTGDFESEYGRPATGWAAQGYDAALLLESALRATQGKTGDRDAVRAGLRRADFLSVRGGFKFNTNHTPILSYLLRKVGRDARGRFSQETQGVVLKDWRDRAAAQCPMRWVEEPLPVVKKP